MRREAEGVDEEEDRAVAGAGVLGRLAGGAEDGLDVLAVRLDRVHAERDGAVGEVVDRAVHVEYGVDSAHLLFSTQKIAGTFQSCARFSASWNMPVFVAPSPRNATATLGSLCCLNAYAAPAMIPSPPPTTAFEPMLPRGMS